MKTYRAIGLMSGSSLDGLDIAYCEFTGEGKNWKHKVLATSYLPYPTKWRLRLGNLTLQNAITYIKTHVFFGHFVGELVQEFIDEQHIGDEVDFIASHGQTIFHQPENHLTSQIGDGAAIATKTGLPVICDFRSSDVALNGEGAPIVPIGDRILFSEYSHCMNLGGIGNITLNLEGNKIIGYDVCAVNSLLDGLAEELDMPYDEDGRISSSGKVIPDLLTEINSSWYFEKDYPKSLNGGWVLKAIVPLIKRHAGATKDKLTTACEHIAIQIGNEVKRISEKENLPPTSDQRILLTGGGAFNKFLVERIRDNCPIEVVVPDEELVKFKEAIIMGLIGVLRVENETNTLSDVTGADRDTIGGAIYQGWKKQLS